MTGTRRPKNSPKNTASGEVQGFLPPHKKVHFFLDNLGKTVMFDVQSESVTLSVDYLISSTQVGLTTCLGFFMPATDFPDDNLCTKIPSTVMSDRQVEPTRADC